MLVRPSVVILTDNKLLLLKYNYGGHDVYGLPGGNPDEDDTLEDTIVRELKEELNLDVEVLQLIIAGEVIFKEKSKSTLHCVFSGRVASGPPVINPEHTSALGYEWKDINELDTINSTQTSANTSRLGYPESPVVLAVLISVKLSSNGFRAKKLKQKDGQLAVLRLLKNFV